MKLVGPEPVFGVAAVELSRLLLAVSGISAGSIRRSDIARRIFCWSEGLEETGFNFQKTS